MYSVTSMQWECPSVTTCWCCWEWVRASLTRSGRLWPPWWYKVSMVGRRGKPGFSSLHYLPKALLPCLNVHVYLLITSGVAGFMYRSKCYFLCLWLCGRSACMRLCEGKANVQQMHFDKQVWQLQSARCIWRQLQIDPQMLQMFLPAMCYNCDTVMCTLCVHVCTFANCTTFVSDSTLLRLVHALYFNGRTRTYTCSTVLQSLDMPDVHVYMYMIDIRCYV